MAENGLPESEYEAISINEAEDQGRVLRTFLLASDAPPSESIPTPPSQTARPYRNLDLSHLVNDPSNGLEKYKRVEGFDGRQNDIIYCPPLSVSPVENGFVDDIANSSAQTETNVAVYFGGDIQDFKDQMELHKENHQYLKWNLEATALLLREQFPQHHIVIVHPNRMHVMTFSCYDNFVPCNNTGVPEHTPNHGSLQHLETLLRNLSELVKRGPKTNYSDCENQNAIMNEESLGGTSTGDPTSTDFNDTDQPVRNASSNSEVVTAAATPGEERGEEDSLVSSTTEDILGASSEMSHTSTKLPLRIVKPNLSLDKSKLTLIGFSKGCVVLNQFLYEFHYLKTLTPDDESMEGFLSRFSHMYWLDGGHSGGKNTWITSRSLLETLKRLGVKIHVHMTPYQLNDERRPWICKEEKSFSDSLELCGARIHRHVHFENASPSLDLHFQLLSEFKTDDDTDEEPDEEDEFDDECLEMC